MFFFVYHIGIGVFLSLIQELLGFVSHLNLKLNLGFEFASGYRVSVHSFFSFLSNESNSKK